VNVVEAALRYGGYSEDENGVLRSPEDIR
jgi:hypothetical protein